MRYWRKQNNFLWSWDASPSYGDDNGAIYVGRDELVNKMAEWIRGPSGGTVLISGVRGVGKTAFVFESIKRSFDIFQKAKITFISKENRYAIFFNIGGCLYLLALNLFGIILNLFRVKPVCKTVVLLDCSQLNPNPLGNWDENSLIDSMIVALYNSDIQTKSIRDDVDKLYNFVKFDTERDRTNTRLYVSRLGIPSLFVLFSFFISQEFLRSSFIIMSIVNFLYQVFSSVDFIHSHKDEVEMKANSKSFSYKYYELLDILRDSKREKFVFVVDELDKINASDDTDGTDRLEELIKLFFKLFKNFILLSGSKFIFITDERYYLYVDGLLEIKGDENKNEDKGNGQKLIDSYDGRVENTYFSWRVFLNLLYSSDFVDFLKKLRKAQGITESSFSVESMGNYLFARSQGVFSSAKRIMRDIFYSDKGNFIFLTDENLMDIYNKLPDKDMSTIGSIVDESCRELAVDGNQLNGNIYRFLVSMLLVRVMNMMIGPDGLNGSVGQIFISCLRNDIKYDLYKHLLVDVLAGFLRECEDVYKEIIRDNGSVYGLEFVYENDVYKIKLPLRYLADKEKNFARYSLALSGFVKKWNVVTKDMELNSSVFAGDVRWILNTSEQREKYWEIKKEIKLYESNKDTYSFSPVLFESYSRFLDVLKKDLIKEKEDKKKIFLRMVVNALEFEIVGSVTVMYEKDNQFVLSCNNKKTILSFLSSTKKNKKVEIKVFVDDKTVGYWSDKDNSELIVKVIGKLKSVLAVTGSQLLFNSEMVKVDSIWQCVPRDGRVFLPNHFAKEISFSVKGGSDYWRFGIGLGVFGKNIEPLGDNRYTLIHLYKNSKEQILKYRIYYNSELKGYTADNRWHGTSIDGVDINKSILVELKYNTITLELGFFVDGSLVHQFKVPRSDMESVLPMAWGDRNEFQVTVSNLKIVEGE